MVLFLIGGIAAGRTGQSHGVKLGLGNEIEVHPSPFERFNTLCYRVGYQYLNNGYRVPAVGGTDKMGGR